MCAVALGPQGKSQHSLLESQPVHDIGHAKLPLSSQRPDYLFNDADGILVADAKWYRSWRNEFPQLPNVVKQLVYGMSLEAGKKYRRTYTFYQQSVPDKLFHILEQLQCCREEKLIRVFLVSRLSGPIGICLQMPTFQTSQFLISDLK